MNRAVIIIYITIGNADDILFKEEDNYVYFLKKYAHYINTIADTYAFCLMPNHFHFLIRMKKISEIDPREIKCLKGLTEENYDKRISQVLNWFGGREHYKEFHKGKVDRRVIEIDY